MFMTSFTTSTTENSFSVCSVADRNYLLFKHFSNSPLLNFAKKVAIQIENTQKTYSFQDIETYLSNMYYVVNDILNTGHYKIIEEKYRVLFAFVCVLRSRFQFFKGDYVKALFECDDGLLKGNDLSNKWLSSFAYFLSSEMLPEPETILNCEINALPVPFALKNSFMIACLERPSMELFYSEFFKKYRPLVIKKIVNEWPAFQKWSFAYLNKFCGHRTVPVELGLKYTDDDWCQKLMTFNEFLKQFVFTNNAEKIGYLAQHRLLDQIPELINDIIVPDYCAFGENGLNDEQLTINIFLGPQGTVSPLHMDPRHNFFCQILGRKFVRLINPTFNDKIALFNDFVRKNTSQIDVENPNDNDFPEFSNVVCEDFVIEAGSCLFIPRGYFHYVKALERISWIKFQQNLEKMGELDSSGAFSSSYAVQELEFIASARTGRRNAVTHLDTSFYALDPSALKLTERLSQLKTGDNLALCSTSTLKTVENADKQDSNTERSKGND